MPGRERQDARSVSHNHCGPSEIEALDPTAVMGVPSLRLTVIFAFVEPVDQSAEHTRDLFEL